MTTTNKKKKKGLKPNLARAIEAKGRAALDARALLASTSAGPGTRQEPTGAFRADAETACARAELQNLA